MIAQIFFLREIDQETYFLCPTRKLIRHQKDALSRRREGDEERGGMWSSGPGTLPSSAQTCGFILPVIFQCSGESGEYHSLRVPWPESTTLAVVQREMMPALPKSSSSERHSTL